MLAMEVSGVGVGIFFLLVLAFHTSSVNKNFGSDFKGPHCFRKCLLETVEPSWVGFTKGLFPLVVPDNS